MGIGGASDSSYLPATSCIRAVSGPHTLAHPFILCVFFSYILCNPADLPLSFESAKEAHQIN